MGPFVEEIERDEGTALALGADDAGIVAEAVFNRAVFGVIDENASTF